jgi:hypothetical protein
VKRAIERDDDAIDATATSTWGDLLGSGGGAKQITGPEDAIMQQPSYAADPSATTEGEA